MTEPGPDIPRLDAKNSPHPISGLPAPPVVSERGWWAGRKARRDCCDDLFVLWEEKDIRGDRQDLRDLGTKVPQQQEARGQQGPETMADFDIRRGGHSVVGPGTL